jgi:hypothetical protein
MTEALIVPINLRALAVTDINRDGTNAAASFVGASADFSRLPVYRSDGTLDNSAPFLADSIGRYPDVTASLGVKLHWSLPAALRHGRRHDAAGPIVFPAVPNRWLVTRLMRVNDEPTPRIKSWVLESDRVERALQPGSGTMPFVDCARTGQFFRYLGRWSDYRGWTEDRGAERFGDIEHGVPLTVVGHGDPLFAGFAPNCPNVFAFDDRFVDTLAQDDRADAPAMPDQPLGARYSLTYLVAGWYADGLGDPLAMQDAQSVRRDFNWAWPDGDMPPRMIASGAVLNLPWSIAAPAQPLPPAPAVAVGASAAEALSALIARHDSMAAVDEAEFTLNAIQSGAFARLQGYPGWTHVLEADLHRRGFAPVHGGWQWAVVDERDTTPGITPEQVKARTVALPDGIAGTLATLNDAQRAYDAAEAAITRARRQLFADWYRRQMLTSVERGDVMPPWQDIAPDLTIERADALLRARMAMLDDQLAALGRLSIVRDDRGELPDPTAAAPAADSLAGQVGAAVLAIRPALHRHWQLQRVPAPRFWRPADPVILLQGEAARPARRDGAAADLLDDGRLPCRRTSDIPGPKRGADAALILQDVLDTDFEALIDTDKAVARATAALVVEALALGGTFDAAFAGIDGFDPKGWRTEASATLPWGAAGDFGLPAPRFARTLGEDQPWTPVLLAWTLRYRPIPCAGRDGAARPIAADLLTAGHKLDAAETELVATLPAAEDPVEYSGWTALSSMASTDLATAIRNAVGTQTDVGERIAGSVRDAPIMAQAAGGFHEALLMFEERPQLRVHNPNEPLLPLADAVRERAAGQSAHTPFWDKPYAALRSGEIELVAATVIDVFGRRIDAAVEQASWSKSFKADDRPVLPARFAQPARLNMRWLAATGDGEESGEHPESSPICGWLVPNLIGGSLDIFSADGRALGMLKAAGNDDETLWHPAPVEGAQARIESGSSDDQRKAIERDIEHRELRALTLAIKQGQNGYLARILATMDDAVGRIIPADPGGGSIILSGRPLALVRARIGLELKGGAATDQGWRAMSSAAAAVAAGRVPAGDDHGLAGVAVAVHLGKTDVMSDGLVGHFMIDEPAGYTIMHSASAQGGQPDVVAATPLIVTPADPARGHDPSRRIALLIDPRAQVHATTGLLPVKRLTIPSATYAPALKRLSKAFFAGPLLFPPDTFPIPLPIVPDHAWQWLRPVAGKWSAVAPGAPSDDRARLGVGLQRAEDGWLVLSSKDPA